MRIVLLIGLGAAAGCYASFPDAPKPPPPEAVSLTAPLLTPYTHKLIVPPAPRRASITSICIDYCQHRAPPREVSGPYVMIVDGTRYRFPEDSVRLLRVTSRLVPENIESIEVISALVATQLYHTDGRPAILIRTKRAK